MKYTEKNPPLVCMQTHSTCYRQTTRIKPVGVLWHSTGANNPNLKRYVQPFETDCDYNEKIAILGVNKNKNDWNHIEKQVGLNGWIGKKANGEVVFCQTMPYEYRPWGCGGGANGSCNDGWIQFEICEDGLNDKTYCDQVYKEACEITAYLCKLYNINPTGTVKKGGQLVPTILCHKDSHDLGLGSNHGDINHWFPKFGYTMETARKDVAKLLEVDKPIPAPVPTPMPSEPQIYRVRVNWADAASQKGAYSNLDNAIKMCNFVGGDFKVFDKDGKQVYPEAKKEEEKEEISLPDENDTPILKIGDTIKLKDGAKWVNGKNIPTWVKNSTLYVRKIEGKKITISIFKTGLTTGTTYEEYIDFPEVEVTPYTVKILELLNVRAEPNSNATIKMTLTKNSVYTIIAEKNGFGKLKSGVGWINLSYTKKVK